MYILKKASRKVNRVASGVTSNVSVIRRPQELTLQQNSSSKSSASDRGWCSGKVFIVWLQSTFINVFYRIKAAKALGEYRVTDNFNGVNILLMCYTQFNQCLELAQHLIAVLHTELPLLTVGPVPTYCFKQRITITKNFCLLHIESNTNIFRLVVQ